MRHAIVVLSLALAALLTVPPGVTAQYPVGGSPVAVYVDGQLMHFDVPPVVDQGRVFIPLRGVFERMGATVDYNPSNQHIVATRAGQGVELTIGSRQANVNGTPTLLDVPAFTVGGRTMVPLRFISESLGANVQWVEAQRTVLIGTAGAGVPIPAPATPPPPQATRQTISGQLTDVARGQDPRIVVRSNGLDYTLAVVPETAVFRYNAETNSGGSASLASLRRGDQVTVIVDGQNQARKITATYRVTPAGRIATVNPGTRVVTLANGQSFLVLNDAEITVNGQASDWSALQNGRIARFMVIEGTNQAYAVQVTSGSAALPPASIVVPRIVSPNNGDTINHSFTAYGTAQPGASVIVKAQPRLFGDATQAQTVADDAGRWRVSMSMGTLPLVAFPYVISVVQVVNGVAFDPVSIEVHVR